MIMRDDPMSFRHLDSNGTEYTDPSTSDHQAEVEGILTGLVVVSVGRGGPVQAAVNRALKAAGAIVMAKTSREEVTRMLRAFVPSVVVTEVVPGDDEGMAILGAVRTLPADRGGGVPVVGVSWETLDRAPMIRAGFQEALVGPFDAFDVARTVLKAVQQRG
jgi:PleD family two-component response regulator